LSFLDSTEEQRCETSGFPCPGFEYKIIDPETGEEQPTGRPGEILVKSYNLMQGYYKKPAETAAAYDAEGWFHSGDMGYLRADGYLRFLGRYKDMLKIGGENVDPMEVEGYLLTMPGIRLAAVVGFPDPRLAEVAVAFVVADDTPAGKALDPAAVHEYCAGRIASFKAPKHVLVADDLPMTSTGKIQKVKLREEAAHRINASASVDVAVLATGGDGS
jgi:fatty-acyl-CoA synthase